MYCKEMKTARTSNREITRSILNKTLAEGILLASYKNEVEPVEGSTSFLVLHLTKGWNYTSFGITSV